jgi:hypothetical protein
MASDLNGGAQTGRDPLRMMQEARNLILALDEEGVTARLLGGLAVALRCPAASPPSPLARTYSDFDIAVSKDGRRKLGEVLVGLEFQAAERFNTINGHVRQLYASPSGVELDVFIERFKMCHEIDLGSRLEVDECTLPLADLMLTKLQVAELTDKDIRDYAALVLDHELRESDDHGINVARLTDVTGKDWGWWKTVTDNLTKVLTHSERLGLSAPAEVRVDTTTRELLDRFEEAPKSLRWRSRAKLGDRIAWRDDPEEKPKQ